MKKINKFFLYFLTLLALSGCSETTNSANVIVSDPEDFYLASLSDERDQDFTSNWKFALGEKSGAEDIAFDDSTWENINIPHDYSLSQAYTEDGEAESGYKPGGVAWYRKSFDLGEIEAGKRYYISFDGVYMNSTTYINGHKLGDHPYGYSPFAFDLTNYIKEGENVIAVRVDNNIPTSRWYSGSGISRNVTLTTTNDAHISKDGIKITSPKLATEAPDKATLNIKTRVENHSDKAKTLTLVHKLLDADGNVVGEVQSEVINAEANSDIDNETDLEVADVNLWDVENPYLYKLETDLKENDQSLDLVSNDYGFRYFEANADTGFYLNGKNIKIKGVCMHHDQGGLGASQYYRAIERQVEILKDMGANLIRVSHNPASKELIDIANKHGMLLIDEAFDGWILPKNGNKNDYSNFFAENIGENEMLYTTPDMTWAEYDIKAMVRRDMNNPSVIMYSMGNEVLEGTDWAGQSKYPDIMADLISWTKEIDDSHFVTMGDNQLKGGYKTNILAMAEKVDEEDGIVGLNYVGGDRYDEIHNDYPDWKLFGSETASSITSRGVYDKVDGGDQTEDKLLTSYDKSKVGWGAFASEAWYDVITRDFVMGEAVWTGFDYLGEPTPWNGTGTGSVGDWPAPKSSYFGIIDTAGLPKDSYYFYQSQWNDEVHTLHILPGWDEKALADTKEVPVIIYTDLDKVELYLTDKNGKKEKIGEQKFKSQTTAAGFNYKTADGREGHESLYAEFTLPFKEGTLSAVGYDESGNVVEETQGRKIVSTTGDFSQIDLKADRETINADGRDLAYITISLNDKDGNTIPTANDEVAVTVENGRLLAMDNGHQADHTPYDAGHRNAHAGKLIAIVAADKPGEMKISAKSGDIEQTISIKAEAKNISSQEISYYRYSKNYLAKENTKINLPKKIKATTAAGREKDIKVDWENFDSNTITTPGLYDVKGVLENGDEILIKIRVLGEIVGFENQDISTSIGQIPKLPEKIEAYDDYGNSTGIGIDINWDPITEEEVKEAGSFKKTGTAKIFGQEYKAEATINVGETNYTVGNNIAPQALRITAEADADLLIDGKKQVKTDIKDEALIVNGSDIVFEYATQQMLAEVNIYLTDLENHELPPKGSINLDLSDTGSDDSYNKIKVKEEIIGLGDNLSQYKLSFDPAQATFIKIEFTDENLAISEIEIHLADIN